MKQNKKQYKTGNVLKHSLLVPLLFMVACTYASGKSPALTQNDLSKQSTGALTLMQVKSQSRSLMLRATHILMLKIVTATPEKWTTRAAGGEERLVALELQLTDVFKGVIEQKVGEMIKIKVSQVKSGFAWGPMPGAWSQVNVEAGTQLMAFCVSESQDAHKLLNDPTIIEFMPVDAALVDVKLATQASDLDLTGLLKKARSQANNLGYLFTDFVWANYADAALKDAATYEQILQAVEWPELNTQARMAWLMSIPDTVLGAEPINNQQVDRLAVTMVRTLAMTSTKVHHENIASTFLFNLVDAGNPESRSAKVVFANYPQEHKKLIDIVNSYAGNPAFKDISAWLER